MSPVFRMDAKSRGDQFERFAERYLHDNKLRTIKRNFSCRGGELDLIMEDGSVLVFVEVRYRNSITYGEPHETVTNRKQARIITAARTYLHLHPKFNDHACRFDVIGITGEQPALHFDWIKNAFSA